MSNKLAIIDNREIITSVATDNKDIESRLGMYIAWLDYTKRSWYQPDLAAYKDKLEIEGYAPTSISAHLSTIRGAYRRLIASNAVRDALYRLTPPDASPADKKAFVDEILIRMRNAIDPILTPVSITQYQDRADSDHLRLTGEQASALLTAPGVDTLMGLRDTALVAVLLCTGVREGELVSLDVPDLRASFGGHTALRIRRGKGNKARLIPYGDMEWCLVIVERWLKNVGIESGAVFRGFFRGGNVIRRNRLTVRAVQYILASYPVTVDGREAHVRPHDCRRTYARRLYETGMDLVAIQQNLGHADTKTTLRYIGTLDADQRRAPALYGFDLSKLTEGEP